MRRKPAAVVLARRGSKVLAVSRPEGGFALPGGMVERGESAAEAAARELEEETGYSPRWMRYLLSWHDERPVHVFEACCLRGRLRSSREGIATWVHPTVVLRGPYGDVAAEAMRRSTGR
jgi:8-oxo-dGTP pyrophosphatase MutT (NUDIX family)